MTIAQYFAIIFVEFGVIKAAKILEKYPTKNYESPMKALVDALSDFVFKCPNKD